MSEKSVIQKEIDKTKASFDYYRNQKTKYGDYKAIQKMHIMDNLKELSEKMENVIDKLRGKKLKGYKGLIWKEDIKQKLTKLEKEQNENNNIKS